MVLDALGMVASGGGELFFPTAFFDLVIFNPLEYR